MSPQGATGAAQRRPLAFPANFRGGTLTTARQGQDPLSKNVAQHLRRAGLDRVRPRAQELVQPPVAVADLPGRSRHVDGALRHALVELRPHELENRSFRSWNPTSLDRGDGAVAIELERARFDRVLRDLLAD